MSAGVNEEVSAERGHVAENLPTLVAGERRLSPVSRHMSFEITDASESFSTAFAATELVSGVTALMFAQLMNLRKSLFALTTTERPFSSVVPPVSFEKSGLGERQPTLVAAESLLLFGVAAQLVHFEVVAPGVGLIAAVTLVRLLSRVRVSMFFELPRSYKRPVAELAVVRPLSGVNGPVHFQRRGSFEGLSAVVADERPFSSELFGLMRRENIGFEELLAAVRALFAVNAPVSCEIVRVGKSLLAVVAAVAERLSAVRLQVLLQIVLFPELLIALITAVRVELLRLLKRIILIKTV